MPWRIVPRAVPVLAAVVLLVVALLGHSRMQHTPGTTRVTPNGTITRTVPKGTIAVGGFSVSHSKIAFVEVSGSYISGLDVINPDGSGLKQLVRCTTRPCGIADPTWSRDGRRIAYLRGRGTHHGNDMSVYVMNANGSGQRRVASCRSGSWYMAGCSSIAWSPDGTRLVLVRALILYVVDLKTSGMRRLTAHTTGADLDPVWSPDGSSIAFAHAPGCGSVCPTLPYVVNADGRGLRQLSRFYGEWDCGGPLWSPDGNTIAFCASTKPSRLGIGVKALNKAIYAVNPDGSHRRLLVPALPTGVNQVQTLAGWSPDGRHILYYRFPWNTSKGPQATSLWMVNANGTGRRVLYHAGHARIGYATWDGQRIVFSVWTNNSQTAGLYTMDADGSHIQRILP